MDSDPFFVIRLYCGDNPKGNLDERLDSYQEATTQLKRIQRTSDPRRVGVIFVVHDDLKPLDLFGVVRMLANISNHAGLLKMQKTLSYIYDMSVGLCPIAEGVTLPIQDLTQTAVRKEPDDFYKDIDFTGGDLEKALPKLQSRSFKAPSFFGNTTVPSAIGGLPTTQSSVLTSEIDTPTISTTTPPDASYGVLIPTTPSAQSTQYPSSLWKSTQNQSHAEQSTQGPSYPEQSVQYAPHAEQSTQYPSYLGQSIQDPSDLEKCTHYLSCPTEITRSYSLDDIPSTERKCKRRRVGTGVHQTLEGRSHWGVWSLPEPGTLGLNVLRRQPSHNPSSDHGLLGIVDDVENDTKSELDQVALEQAQLERGGHSGER